ncbi:MAG: hypothetical protein KUF80_00290 [Candidatus Thiodiazotropha sp. (ex Codakia orbicularis)]|nr:hypothetical protein [Candidatus Thiodiazotropha taylori]MBV2093298.1 hypothetical protein [Candidatus Thiodiazotropha sp. (ex Codakia orbicularis)]
MHFTYHPPNNSKLKQGDILERTAALVSLLEQYHPHYAKPDYKYFQVLTQSCDLVLGRRGKSCKARYITIAAVRDIGVAVNRYIEETTKDIVEFDGSKFISQSNYYNVESFIKKILNNNETNYFFLNKEPEIGLHDNLCTFLRLSVSLKSDDHYALCTKAKILELTSEFQAKLGWLVGNLYSRVGTDDYAPGTNLAADQYKSYVQDVMSEYIGMVPDKIFRDFKKVAKHTNNMNELDERMLDLIETKKKSRLSNIISVIGRVVQLDETQKEKLRNVLSQDGSVKRIIDP